MQPTRCLICTSSTSACKLASCLLFSRSGTERPGTRTNKNCLGPTYHTAVTSKGCECACMCLCHRIQVVWHSSSDVCIPGLARFKLHLSPSPVGLLLRLSKLPPAPLPPAEPVPPAAPAQRILRKSASAATTAASTAAPTPPAPATSLLESEPLTPLV